jgi:1-acyl-sn-glycerol-3-phosphate acyltransferase
MIRFIVAIIFVFFFLLFSIPIQFVEWLIGLKDPKKKATSSLAIVNWAFGVVIGIAGTKVTVIGEENVPKDEAVLYVGNHRSYFDIILTYVRMPYLCGFVAKEEMLRYPVLRTWMKYLYCSFLNRNNLKQGMQLILKNIEYLKEGISVFVFPEGTRNKTDEVLLPFHDGSLKMAEKSGAPIIPVTMNNTAAIFEDHIPKIKKAHVVIEYGKPIYMKDMSREEKKAVSGQIQEILKTTYLKNAELV